MRGTMLFKVLTICLLLVCISTIHAENAQAVVERTLKGLNVAASEDPYSRTIEKIFIGFDAQAKPKTAIAYREIESFKPITGIVIVDKTADGFILREALFPDIGKIKNAKDRKQILTLLKQFKNIPFDPYAEKSAVDGLTGATRYGIKTSGYLNYMARVLAKQMDNPPDWAKPNKK
jgi:hypothetical protein